MANRLSALAVTFATVVILAGCGPAYMQDDVADARLQRDRITVQVENFNWADMVIYAAHAGSRIRLGTVQSMARDRLTIPPGSIPGTGEIRLVAAPIGARWTYATEPLFPVPGQEIRWTLENNIQLSSFRIR